MDDPVISLAEVLLGDERRMSICMVYISTLHESLSPGV